eukprot:6795521-Prymnesium_polylepis.1
MGFDRGRAAAGVQAADTAARLLADVLIDPRPSLHLAPPRARAPTGRRTLDLDQGAAACHVLAARRAAVIAAVVAAVAAVAVVAPACTCARKRCLLALAACEHPRSFRCGFLLGVLFIVLLLLRFKGGDVGLEAAQVLERLPGPRLPAG